MYDNFHQKNTVSQYQGQPPQHDRRNERPAFLTALGRVWEASSTVRATIAAALLVGSLYLPVAYRSYADNTREAYGPVAAQ